MLEEAGSRASAIREESTSAACEVLVRHDATLAAQMILLSRLRGLEFRQTALGSEEDVALAQRRNSVDESDLGGRLAIDVRSEQISQLGRLEAIQVSYAKAQGNSARERKRITFVLSGAAIAVVVLPRRVLRGREDKVVAKTIEDCLLLIEARDIRDGKYFRSPTEFRKEDNFGSAPISPRGRVDSPRRFRPPRRLFVTRPGV